MRLERYLRRLIVAVLAIALLSAFLPVAISRAAETGKCGEHLVWSLDGGRLTITGVGEMTDFSEENMPPWYSYANEITTVTVESGVTTIGELAFFECGSLTNAILPETLHTIGIRAFKDCVSLGHFNLPTSVYEIGESAFENCKSLANIKLSDGFVILGDKAFYRCSSLTSIIIPSSVEFFGMVTFAFCTQLMRAEIRCPIELLPDWTFYGCTNLTIVSLPDMLTTIGNGAFHDCVKLSAVHYNGEDLDDIYDQIVSDDKSLSGNGGVMPGQIGNTAGTVEEKRDEQVSVYTDVTETDNSVITVKEEVDYSSGTPDVSHTSVSATIYNDAGWEELSDKLQEILDDHTKLGMDPEVEVRVQTTGDGVPSSILQSFSEDNMTMTVTINDGTSREIILEDIAPDTVTENTDYDLTCTINEVKPPKGIESEKVYQLTFGSDVGFNSHVELKLGEAYSDRVATIYEEDGFSVKVIQSVKIEPSGAAKFALANTDKEVKYYVGIDVPGIAKEDVIITKTETDGEVATLMGMDGNMYKVTGRKSKWGITGGQFALYAGLGIGFVVLLISIIMIAINKIKHGKRVAKEAAGASAGGEIDREALYDEVLRDLLEEANQKKSKKKKK